jgi:hypothetical protein
MVMAGDQQVRDYYHPTFLIDRDGVKRYSEGGRENERPVGQILH